ncbi:MAG: hypothetical protein PHX74_08010 [Candidatus Sumerlaeales bacterium]|nr:hypothetical protein [Candidatus Sumerlaeales bacterium]
MNLSRQTVVVAAARLTTQAAIVISGIVIGRFLLREQAGIVQKGLLVTNMCILMGMFGIQTFLYTALPKTPDENKRSLFVQSLLFLSVIGALLATAVFVGRVPLAHYLNAPEMTSLLMWAALSILLSLPAGAAEPLLIATGHPWRALCMAIPASCLQLAVLFYACVFAPDNASAIPKAVFIGLTLAALTRVIIGLFHAATTLQGKWMPTQWHQSLKDLNVSFCGLSCILAERSSSTANTGFSSSELVSRLEGCKSRTAKIAKASIRKHHRIHRSPCFKEQNAYVRQASPANSMAHKMISQTGITGDRNILPSLNITNSLFPPKKLVHNAPGQFGSVSANFTSQPGRLRHCLQSRLPYVVQPSGCVSRM